MKIVVKSRIESINDKKSFESKAIKDLNKYKYMEDDALVVLEKKGKSVILKRTTKDYTYTFTFNSRKSTLVYTLKDNNLNFSLNFKTNKIICDDEHIYIEYTLEDVKYKYELIIKEEL